MQLRSPTPPRLPDPSGEYSAGYFSQLLNVLRLYFNQLGNAIGALLGPTGSAYLQSPYGKYESLVSQTIASTTTAYAVTFNTTIFQSAVALSSGSRLAVQRPGIYRATVRVQFANAGSSIQTAAIWYRKNGVDVPGSRARFSITGSHGGSNGHIAAELSYMFSLAENDYIEAWWFADSANISLEYLPPATAPVRPAAASAAIALLFVSANVTL